MTFSPEVARALSNPDKYVKRLPQEYYDELERLSHLPDPVCRARPSLPELYRTTRQKARSVIEAIKARVFPRPRIDK